MRADMIQDAGGRFRLRPGDNHAFIATPTNIDSTNTAAIEEVYRKRYNILLQKCITTFYLPTEVREKGYEAGPPLKLTEVLDKIKRIPFPCIRIIGTHHIPPN